MNDDSVVGPDNLTGEFFVAAWEFIGIDVYKAILSVFINAELPRSIISTPILLLFKVQFSQQFSEFRPISLCNFIKKTFKKF